MKTISLSNQNRFTSLILMLTKKKIENIINIYIDYLLLYNDNDFFECLKVSLTAEDNKIEQTY